MLTQTKTMLLKAKLGNYAVGAFNINNMEIGQAIIEAAEREHAPVICQTSEGSIEYAGMDMLLAIGRELARSSKIPMSLHLDHGKNVDIVKQAIHAGYESVMYDGSSHEFKRNIELTRSIVSLAHSKSISVEAELGAIAGIEDFVSIEDQDANLTNPEQAKEFVKQTKCDFLAIAIGTAHGAYKFTKKSKLDLNRLKEIKKQVKIPLVLHGASSVPKSAVKKIKKYGGDLGKPVGVSNKDLKRAVKLGINKVNTDTDVRLAFTGGVRKLLKKEKDQFDPRKILKPAYEEIVDMVRWKIRLLGSSNKA
ncbi:fructose-1,6-bisphosphate aldolase, class II [bacterium]|nr:fructose-1,6-bisphosphate aldolase, class II [bacterium]MDP6571419.1 class II fructose-1,6-bisphosphate aldolase [Patescibacteria group bacterium]MDP6756394.1 class II fructose-1,6-bisphosphate aldolase [Patescibacteria group bacterium]